MKGRKRVVSRSERKDKQSKDVRERIRERERERDKVRSINVVEGNITDKGERN